MSPSTLPITLHSGFTFDMVFVEGGSFRMGDNQGLLESEKPEHSVKIESFYLGKHPVTQGLWKEIMGNNPSRFIGKDRPVERVSWQDAQLFIEKLIKTTFKPFRLPSEAEWEYSARGGIYSQGYRYAGSDKLSQVGWYEKNSDDQTHEVGLLLPNELGLYDMSGNVYEWCEDDFSADYQGAPRDGMPWLNNPIRSPYRVLRGGSAFLEATNCRTGFRVGDSPTNDIGNIGFRLALSLTQTFFIDIEAFA
jgi:formylglycine-generating enzyme required for sulfatase activity